MMKKGAPGSLEAKVPGCFFAWILLSHVSFAGVAASNINQKIHVHFKRVMIRYIRPDFNWAPVA